MANLCDEIYALLKVKIGPFEEYCRNEQKYSDAATRARGAADFLRFVFGSKPPRRNRVRHPPVRRPSP